MMIPGKNNVLTLVNRYDATTTVVAGDTVDLKGYAEVGRRQMLFVGGGVNATSDASNLDLKIQEAASTADSDFDDITGGAFTTIASSTDQGWGIQYLELPVTKRYVRAYPSVDTAAAWAIYCAAVVTHRTST
jgi:hypothetical protein